MSVPHTNLEHWDFLMAIKEGKQTVMNPEVGQRTSTVCHLGNIAARVDRRLEWDAKKEVFVDDDEANTLCSKTPRDEWSYDKILKMKC